MTKPKGPNDEAINELLSDPPAKMTEWEYNFLEDMLGRLMLSDRQQETLDNILHRYSK